MAKQYKYLRRWKKPQNFFQPQKDQERRLQSYPILGRSRDSLLPEDLNYRMVLESLTDKEKELGGSPGETPWVWADRDSHWACGWVECIYVDMAAPPELLQHANDLLDYLDNDYYILSEDRYDKERDDFIRSYWDNSCRREKIDLLKKYDKLNEEEASRIEEAEEEPTMTDAIYDALLGWGW